MNQTGRMASLTRQKYNLPSNDTNIQNRSSQMCKSLVAGTIKKGISTVG